MYRKSTIILTALVLLIILGFGSIRVYHAITMPDTQCSTAHNVSYNPPLSPKLALDYFIKGNYYYDKGDCKQAIKDYTTSIKLNPDYPQTYNNRAYTYMRMKDYKEALDDLNKALTLNPNYINALMNRGDLYNYYGPVIDRKKAIADYEKVISLGGVKGTSVCGHLFLAQHNGWNLGTVLDFPRAFGVCHWERAS